MLDTEMNGDPELEGEDNLEGEPLEDDGQPLDDEGIDPNIPAEEEEQTPAWKTRFPDAEKMFRSYRAAERQLTRISQQNAELQRRTQELERISQIAAPVRENNAPDMSKLTDEQLNEFANDPAGFVRKHFTELSQQTEQESLSCQRVVDNALDEVAEDITVDEKYAEMFERDPELAKDMWKYCSKHPVLSYLMDQISTANYKNHDLRAYYKPLMEMATKMAIADRHLERPNVRADVKKELKKQTLIKNRLATNLQGSRSRQLGASKSDPASQSIKDAIRQASL